MVHGSTTVQAIFTIGLFLFGVYGIDSYMDGVKERKNSQSIAYNEIDKTDSYGNANKSHTKKVTDGRSKNWKPFYCKKAVFKKMTFKHRRYCK